MDDGPLFELERGGGDAAAGISPLASPPNLPALLLDALRSLYLILRASSISVALGDAPLIPVLTVAAYLVLAYVILRWALELLRFAFLQTNYRPGVNSPLPPEIAPRCMEDHPARAAATTFPHGWFRVMDSRELKNGGVAEKWLCGELGDATFMSCAYTLKLFVFFFTMPGGLDA